MGKRTALIASALALLLGSTITAEDSPRGKSVPVLRRYADFFKLDGRKEKIPDEFIADDRRWAEVWQILHGEMERPKVDFKEEIVLVGIGGDENQFSIETTLNEQGNLRMALMSTLVGYVNPTTGNYVLNVISRKGIKTINGKPLRIDVTAEVSPPSKRLPILRRHAGKIPLSRFDERLADGVIMDERRWGEVWQVLCGNAVRPDVDFKKEIVLVAINRDENFISSEPLLNGDGDLEVRNSVTLMHSPFPTNGTYAFSVVSRRGIKTIQGRPLRMGIWRATTNSESYVPSSGGTFLR